jgi:hypothetical protein
LLLCPKAAAEQHKYFAASELLEQVQERAWLAKVANALNRHWQKRNAAGKNHPATGPQNGHVPAVGQFPEAGDYPGSSSGRLVWHLQGII